MSQVIEINVEAGTASETTTGVARGVDVDFTLTIEGLYTGPACDADDCERATCVKCGACPHHGPACNCEHTIEGEVTLLPHEDGSPGYGSWGAPDNWLDGRTIASLRKLAGGDYTEILSEIESACAVEAKRFASNMSTLGT